MKIGEITIKTQLSKDERGVSLIVVMVMIIVITLLVLGFAQISNHEQRDSLDNQLAYQAYYAAESGINDVAAYLKTYPALVNTSKSTCINTGGGGPGTWGDFYANYQQKLSAQSGASNVQNTCILVSTTPASLIKQFPAVGTSWAVPLYTTSYNDVTSVSFSLAPAAGVTPDLANCGADFTSVSGGGYTLPSAEGDCGYAALRFDLVQIGVGSPGTDASTNPSALIENTMSGLFVPQSGAGPSSYPFVSNNNNLGAGAQDVYPFSCTATACTATINIPAVANEYYLRILPLYNTGTVTVNGMDTTPGNANWRDAQVEVDSTGKSQNELKRLQATLPVNYGGTFSTTLPTPDYGLQTSQSICKDLIAHFGQATVSQDPANCPVY